MSPKEILNIDIDNVEFQNALSLVADTNQSVFLTGKAGTGKSTFLKYICAHTKKNYIILAPTGIAAVNVGGVTIHSFFKMPLKPLIPDDPDYSPRKIRKTIKFSKEKVKIIKELDLIIVDEISMVRADMIDFMDKVLRIYSNNMREPFGGKQLLLVGDVFQLEPVVTSDMRDILRHYYKDFFFFNAMAFSEIKVVPIELKKIYRQTDVRFISLLDKIRINQATEADIQLLNGCYNPDYRESQGDFVITLATRRDTVDTINDMHLAELQTEAHTFVGRIEGTFPLQNLPTSRELTLKVGAQVIFIRNDRNQRWINGTVGKISEIGDDYIEVELEDGKKYSLQPEQWENMQYEYDEKEKKIKETILGVFEQFPVKLAWALTIHKSQGLTFNKVVIDLSGGAFSSGQTYVALSRCTSLDGIVLRQPLRQRDIIVNRSVVEFSRQFNSSTLISEAFNRAKANRCFIEASRAFDKCEFGRSIDCFEEAMEQYKDLDKPLLKRFIRRKLNIIHKLKVDIIRQNELMEEQKFRLQGLAKEFASLGKSSLELSATDPVSVKSAIANFNKALELWPECFDALVGKAEMLTNLDEIDDALDLYSKALKVSPNDSNVNYKSGLLKYRQKDYPGALITLKRALRSNKTNPKIHDTLADVYEEIGLEDKAEEHRDEAKWLRKEK